MAQAWLVVTSAENFETTRAMGFTVQGVKSRHGKKAQTIASGDVLVYYITGLQVFAATAQVTSPCYQDETPLWQCKTRPSLEVYPWRVKIQPQTVLPVEAALPVGHVYRQLTYLKKWPEAHWRLGFQGNLHLWPMADFDCVHHAIQGLIREEAPV